MTPAGKITLMEGPIDGTAVSKFGESYEYSATWLMRDTLLWDAVVKRDGVLKGMPGGVVENIPPGADLESIVRSQVVGAIWHLASIER
jgi:hypothetical protein